MKPKRTNHEQGRLFQQRLSQQLDPQNFLCQLAKVVEWEKLESAAKPAFAKYGAPAKPVRLMTGLMLLQSMYAISDEAMVETWVENPYWQLFCGYDYLQWECPLNPSTLSRWRSRMGDKFCELLLMITIDIAVDNGLVQRESLKETIVDTTVMPKNIAYPVDARLLYRALTLLAKQAKRSGLKLRQTYLRTGKKAATRAACYARARQMRRMKKEVKYLKTRVGRVVRDIERKIEDTDLVETFASLLSNVSRLLTQQKGDSDKIYSLHEPSVQCIAKGKAHQKYEFGCKVSLVVTHKDGLALSMEALPGNPYDGHTLNRALLHASKLSGVPVGSAYVDKGYRGHGVPAVAIYHSGQRPASRSLKRKIKRRQSIEPRFGHMKNEGRLGRNYLRGVLGDQVNALFCGIGHNLHLIRRRWVPVPS